LWRSAGIAAEKQHNTTQHGDVLNGKKTTMKICHGRLGANRRTKAHFENNKQGLSLSAPDCIDLRKTAFLSHLYINASFYQDRLGTNVGKALKKAAVFRTGSSTF